MIPRMVLLVVSLLLACMPTPTSSAISFINRENTGALEVRLSWDDDADPAQTYTLIMKDIKDRTSYTVTGFTEKEILFDNAGQSQFLFGTIPLVIRRSQTYQFNVRGERDSQGNGAILGYMQDMIGPPEYQVICGTEDETSDDPNMPQSPPGGCQSPQVDGTVRLYYAIPTDTGWHDGKTQQILGWAFQWSKDATFTTDVVEEQCIEAPGGVALLVGSGAVCNSRFRSGQIPRSGTIAGTYYIRTAAIINLGTGPFTEAISVYRELACEAGTYSSFDKTVCVTCPSGTYSAESGATSISTCTVCPVSTYSSVIGAVNSATCTPCEIGKVTSRPGATWVAQCVVTPSSHMC